ncbi:MAG: PH domain-containing protein [Candidatus Ranarchaeia archaeon]
MNITNQEGKIIKPPLPEVAYGKIFKPSNSFRNKLWIKAILTLLILTGIIFYFCLGLVLGYAYDKGLDLNLILNQWFIPVLVYTIIGNFIWFIPYFVVTPFYVNRIEYSIRSEAGGALPEIYVRKGIINVTKKHVPFRTITNISTRTGIFDRMFGLGNINIETAGFSAQKMGPEEKLEGIEFYKEVRDFILQELRKFRSGYTTTTENPVTDKNLEQTPDSEFKEKVLKTLEEIRDSLKK